VADDVHRGHVPGEDAQRIGNPALGVARRVVDHVAPEDRQFQVADALERLGARFRHLAGDASDPEHRLVGQGLERAGQHVEHGGLVRDVLGGAFRRVLGAVTRLHHVSLARGDLGQQES